MFDLTVAPREVFLFPDGFISFEPTVGPTRSVTVKAKFFYGIHKLQYMACGKNKRGFGGSAIVRPGFQGSARLMGFGGGFGERPGRTTRYDLQLVPPAAREE